MDSTQIDVMMKVIATLDNLQIPYAIGGSYASAAHGFARATRDIDLIADMKITQVDEFVRSLENDFYVEREAVLQAINLHRAFNIIHENSFVKVDIFAVQSIGFPASQLSRRILEIFVDNPENKAYVVTAEDIVLAKLDWYRKGNFVSTQPWQDIKEVIRVQANKLDHQYLKHWAQELGISDLLTRAFDEAVGT
jgi:hypothetical protein